MTKNSFARKLRQALRITDEEVLNQVDKYLRSGAVDVERHTEDMLVKILIYAALKETAERIRPLSKSALAEANNLRHF